ncbi:uncharacterized protein GGS25DRAFT_369265 [Hypoxylon fragiforme]|uniref:uncharacterized protein n=1 Tax=Hypoxylon fragiforme TaxID=63214 RepID=UPI0020C69804|nr:uncharacterized protein GGS25DRAFT_369265 [Hypoxylon fragiforme]KAI2606013.1 hypothetical protein GGS25DRAFT_369265 [Hypoxylon fragiforme]
MANLPSQHPHLSLHLTDRALTPLITSSRSRPQLDALTSLSHSALNAHESALRLGLGAPQRIIVEHDTSTSTLSSSTSSSLTTSSSASLFPTGPVLLQSFLRANPSSSPFPPSRPSTSAAARTNGQPTPRGARSGNDSSSSFVSNSDSHHDEDESTPQPENSPSPATSPTHTHTLEQRLHNLQLQTTGISAMIDDTGGGSPSSEEDANAPPMLVSIVIAPTADDARDGRRAAARLERVGREVQARWAGAQEQQQSQQQAEEGLEDGRGGVDGGAGD